MNISDIAICWKRSGFEWDLHRYPHHTAESLREFYRSQNRDPERMEASHRRQQANFELVREKFPDRSQFISRNDLTRERVAASKLFVVGGGDNHFTWASHYTPFDVPMLLVNSDQVKAPNEGSDGGLLNFSVEEFLELIPALSRDAFEVEEWTLLEVLVAGVHRGYVTSEVFVGERDRTDCSRNWVELPAHAESHVGSGEVIATPAGVTGWYDSATRFPRRFANFEQQLAEFDPTAYATKEALFAALKESWEESGRSILPDRTKRALYLGASELFYGGGREYQSAFSEVAQGESLRLTSLNDAHGIVRIDADEALTTPFPPGTEVEIRVADESLKVVKNPLRR